MKRLAWLGLLLLTGCINMTTVLQPDAPEVKPTLEGSDCVPILFGIGIGTATLEQAKANGRDRKREPDFHGAPIPIPITKVHRVQFTDYWILGFGARCVQVFGES